MYFLITVNFLFWLFGYGVLYINAENFAGSVINLMESIKKVNLKKFDVKLIVDLPFRSDVNVSQALNQLAEDVAAGKINKNQLRAELDKISQPISNEVRSCSKMSYVNATSPFGKRLFDHNVNEEYKHIAFDAYRLLFTDLRKCLSSIKNSRIKTYTKKDTLTEITKLSDFLKNNKNPAPRYMNSNVFTFDSNERNYSTLLAAPFPHVVPGERFSEFYYWDSHWVIGAFAAGGAIEEMENMIRNYFHFIDTYNFIPNGARSYYLDRSQPPLLYRSLAVYFSTLDYTCLSSEDKMIQAIPRMLADFFGFWLNPKTKHIVEIGNQGNITAECLKNTETIISKTHALNISNDEIAIDCKYLFRYYSQQTTPRLESYTSDVEVLEKLEGKVSKDEIEKTMQSIRAAAESGWDFSERWSKSVIETGVPRKDGEFFLDIDTISVAPIELNALLTKAASFIAETITEVYGTSSPQVKYLVDILYSFSQSMTLTMTELKMLENYNDLNLRSKKLSKSHHAGSIFACEVMNPFAQSCEQKDLLFSSGSVTTLYSQSSQQWDYPNVWAPLQGLIYDNIVIYNKNISKINKHSFTASINFFKTVKDVYSKDGIFYEKYSVENNGAPGHGGEYEVQRGFGWTNGMIVQTFAYADLPDFIRTNFFGIASTSFFLKVLFFSCIFVFFNPYLY